MIVLIFTLLFQSQLNASSSLGLYGSQSVKLAANSKGHLFAVGQGIRTEKDRFGMVRASYDGGKTWETVDVLTGTSPSPRIFFNDIAIDKDRIYVAGARHLEAWILRGSFDGGKTWKTLREEEGSFVNDPDLTVDENGTIYVQGRFYGKNNANPIDVIFKSGNQGARWERIELPKDFDIRLADLTIDSDGTMFLSGSTDGRWIVAKSQNQGRAWTIIDHGQIGSAKRLVRASRNELYVIGLIREDKLFHFMSVRKSEDNGQTWKTVDVFSDTHQTYESDIQVDSKGNVFAVGMRLGEDWKEHKVLRVSTDKGKTWKHLEPEPLGSIESITIVEKPGARFPDIYFAGMRQVVTRNRQEYFYYLGRSRDGGQTLEELDPYLP